MALAGNISWKAGGVRSGPRPDRRVTQLALAPRTLFVPQNRCVNRRDLLAAGTVLSVLPQKSVTRAATAVYHEISVELPDSSQLGSLLPKEDPPTFIKATGKVLASKGYISPQRGPQLHCRSNLRGRCRLPGLYVLSGDKCYYLQT